MMDIRVRKLRSAGGGSSPNLSRSLPTSRTFPTSNKTNCFQQCLNTSTDSLASVTCRSPKLGQYRKIPNLSECDMCRSLCKEVTTLKCFHSACGKCLDKCKVEKNGCPVCIADSLDSRSNSSNERTTDEYSQNSTDDLIFDDLDFERDSESVADLIHTLETNVLETLTTKHSEIKNEHHRLVKETADEIEKIRNHVTNLKALIDKKAETLIRNAQESTARHCAELERQEKHLKEFTSQVKDSIQTYHDMLDLSSDTPELQRTAEESARRMIKLTDQFAAENVHIKFNVKTTSDVMLDNMVGRVGVRVFLVNTLRPNLQRSFVMPAAVQCICPINSRQAWLGYQTVIQLFSKSGERSTVVDLYEDVQDMCLDEDGNLLVACHNSVKLVTQSHHVLTLFSCTETPHGITCLPDGSLAMCIGHEVIVCDKEGNHVSKFHTEGIGDTKMPYKLVRNVNGDICVSDFQSSYGDVAIFDSNGRPVAKIRTEAMAPRGITCNKQGLIYVCDFRADRINVYSTHGHFLQTLINSSHGLSGPLSVAIDPSGDLWMSDWKRKVRVFSQTVETPELESSGNSANTA